MIEPGMICSVEPGMYFEGRFGTRTENLILCAPDEKNEYGQFLRFEFLTWAPIDLDAIDTGFMDEQDIKRFAMVLGMNLVKLYEALWTKDEHHNIELLTMDR